MASPGGVKPEQRGRCRGVHFGAHRQAIGQRAEPDGHGGREGADAQQIDIAKEILRRGASRSRSPKARRDDLGQGRHGHRGGRRTEPEAIVRSGLNPRSGIEGLRDPEGRVRCEVPAHAQNQMVNMVKRLVKAYQEADATWSR